MSEKTVYNDLVAAGLTPAGACAMLGNMMAESSLIAGNVQDGMTKLTDAQYTLHFDRVPEDCYDDGIGYGLCQWTHPARKRELWEFVHNRGASVASEEAQTAFAVWELRTYYTELWDMLCRTDDINASAERICREYERPAVNNITVRSRYAREAYDRLVPHTARCDLSILIMQAVLNYNEYPTALSGVKDAAFLATLVEFVRDMGAAI